MAMSLWPTFWPTLYVSCRSQNFIKFPLSVIYQLPNFRVNSTANMHKNTGQKSKRYFRATLVRRQNVQRYASCNIGAFTATHRGGSVAPVNLQELGVRLRIVTYVLT